MKFLGAVWSNRPSERRRRLERRKAENQVLLFSEDRRVTLVLERHDGVEWPAGLEAGAWVTFHRNGVVFWQGQVAL